MGAAELAFVSGAIEFDKAKEVKGTHRVASS